MFPAITKDMYIKNTGAALLESLTKKLLELSQSQKTSPYYSFESYCALPFLYDRYATEVMKLSEDKSLKPSESDALKSELSKIADPLLQKSKDLADECLLKATQSEHDGPEFRRILNRWGWAQDSNLRKLVSDFLSSLSKKPCLWDQMPSGYESKSETEKTILQNHITGKSSAESWFAPSKIRYDQNKQALSKLTLVDALNRYPQSGKILNA